MDGQPDSRFNKNDDDALLYWNLSRIRSDAQVILEGGKFDCDYVVRSWRREEGTWTIWNPDTEVEREAPDSWVFEQIGAGRFDLCVYENE